MSIWVHVHGRGEAPRQDRDTPMKHSVSGEAEEVGAGGFVSRRLRFDGPIQRRRRLLGRLIAAAATPALYPTVPVARAFWFDGIANFGDALTPWLLRRAGIVPIHAQPRTAELTGVGSVLEMLPSDFAGAVWGSGLLKDGEKALPNATILAVRGELTRERVGANSTTPLGDPGILVSRFLRRPRTRWRLGIVPHHMHEADPLWKELRARAPRAIHIIDVRRGASVVVREIAACEYVLSTSLHGLITADSFGIPAVWARREPDLWGGRFKFHDYESAVTPGASREMKLWHGGMTADDVIGQAHTVDAIRIGTLQSELLAGLSRLDLPRFSPPLAARRAFER